MRENRVSRYDESYKIIEDHATDIYKDRKIPKYEDRPELQRPEYSKENSKRLNDNLKVYSKYTSPKAQYEEGKINELRRASFQASKWNLPGEAYPGYRKPIDQNDVVRRYDRFTRDLGISY